MKQRKLKKGGLILLITLLSMIPPLSTDLYMPALPELVTYFNTTTSITSWTMTIFFIFMAFGTLVLGPISDKYGRKPILVWSTILTLICSTTCAFSPTIIFLIIVRAIQAFSAGGMLAIGTALIKDSFEGSEIGKVLSITQALAFIAPMAAPILGALILKVSDWRMTFIALAVLNAITLLIVLLLDETLPAEQRVKESIIHSILGLSKVVKNSVFTNILLVGGFLTAPYMAYLAVASYVYVNGFHTSETMFSVYFAITSAFTVVGPLLYGRFGKKPFKKVLWICFSITTLVGILLLTIGQISPVLFLLSYIPFAVTTTYIRPYTADLLLNVQNQNVGASSAVMNFGFTILGSLGMFIGSLRWPNYVSGIAFTIFIFTVLSMVIFIAANKFKVFKDIGHVNE
ncbi:MFS transporter [Ruminiclostridium herbifermentans]|uniref:MFS transporter n=1 Tax=Ruminiclostridium herbifermentans TaxID=2488810 RepID=A0A4U7JNN2_9FIRM|nr:MFS transporter [Ruminiclostridium herbifermentans]QNU68299.1 MFS transporter [Ruminiclostridium herbifermentans]